MLSATTTPIPLPRYLERKVGSGREGGAPSSAGAASPQSSVGLTAEAIAARHDGALRVDPARLGTFGSPPTVVATPLRSKSERSTIQQRLFDHGIHTKGDRQLRDARVSCTEPLQTLMRLAHPIFRLAALRDGLKLPRYGSDLLARIGGVSESVGELLPGLELFQEMIADSSLVGKVVRRRITLDNRDCWMALDAGGFASLAVKLSATGDAVRLMVRPSAKTECAWGAAKGARLAIAGTGRGVRPSGVRLGRVVRVRPTDGLAMILYDDDRRRNEYGMREPVAVDLRPPLTPMLAGSGKHEAFVRAASDAVRVRVRLVERVVGMHTLEVRARMDYGVRQPEPPPPTAMVVAKRVKDTPTSEARPEVPAATPLAAPPKPERLPPEVARLQSKVRAGHLLLAAEMAQLEAFERRTDGTAREERLEGAMRRHVEGRRAAAPEPLAPAPSMHGQTADERLAKFTSTL